MPKTQLFLKRPFVLFIALLAANAPAQQSKTGKTHVLKPTPATVAYGHYDAKTPPVPCIRSGDTVEVHTLITSTPERLEGAGVKPEQIETALRDIAANVTNKLR